MSNIKKRIKYLFIPTLQKINYKLLVKKWQRNYFRYTLDIDWDKYNYNRISIINLLLVSNPDAKYLEIGCSTNATFNSVIALHKVGVDPEKGGTHRLTSDEFFVENQEKFDVIFIDGLHTYEQARIDIRNALKCLNNGSGWIVLHDMIPRNWLEEHIPRISKSWTGDVWKVAFEICQASSFGFKIIKIDRGVGVLRVCNNEIVLPDLQSELLKQRFSYFYNNYSKLPIVEYDEGRKWILNHLR